MKKNIRKPDKKQHSLLDDVRYLAIVIAVAVCIVYLPCINNNFIWDDDVNIYQNGSLQEPDGLRKIWGSFSLYQYYPLTFSSFYIEHLLWGFNPAGYHIASIVLHSANAILVFFLLQHLGLQRLRALFVALLFSIHPIQAETVAWATERKNLLSGLFYFSAALIYLKFLIRGKKSLYGFSLFFFACALLSKTATVTLPLTLLLAEYLMGRPITRKAALRLLPFLALGLIMGFITTYLETYRVLTIGDEWDFSMVQRAIIASRVLLFYPLKIIFPFNMSFIYPQWQINSLTLIGLWPLLLVLGLGTVLAWQKGRIPPILWFSLGHYIVTIMPASGLINFYFLRYSFVQNHFQYLAGLGIMVAIGTIGANIINTTIKGQSAAFMQLLVGFLVLLGCALMTNKECSIYRDNKTLWTDTISKNSTAWMAHSNLGMILAQEGALDLGIASLKKSIALNPNFEEAHNNLGTAYVRKGMLDEAIEEYKKALVLEPKLAEAHYNLGAAYFQKGMPDEAIAAYQKALSLKPAIADGHKKLGLAFLKKNKLEEATNEFKKAITIDPSADTYYTLGLVYGKRQMYDEAITQLKMSVTLDPNFAMAHYYLSVAYHNRKEYALASSHYDRSKTLGVTLEHPMDVP